MTALQKTCQLFRFNVRATVRFLVVGVLLVFTTQLTHAQAGPLTESSIVTASVGDNNAPSTPILISPANGAVLTSSTMTFVWQASTDDSAMDFYQLYINGSLYLDNLPLSSTATGSYVLTYDSGTQQYTLVVTAPFSDGSYTWKIRAVDIYDNGADSATWSFTIDTQAPTFVITQIGDETVSISAQDVSTIPVTPIELEVNAPLLVGTGEPGSTVQLTVSVPGDLPQNFTFTINPDGTWEQQLGNFPRDTIITLDFTITDAAGNISILNGVRFTIPSDEIVIGPSPSPIVVIPITPPDEVIEEVIEEVTEGTEGIIAELASVLPPELVVFIESIPEVVSQVAKALAPISAVVASVAVPVATGFLVFGQLGQEFSWRLLSKLLQAIGLLPKKKPQGLVFNSQNNEPVAFALLTVTSTPTGGPGGQAPAEPIQETVVTDVHGVYQGIKLPPGWYQITVSHQDYTFPTKQPRPGYQSFQDFYRGEAFQVSSEEVDQLFLIPVDPVDQSKAKKTLRGRFRILIAQFNLSDLAAPLGLFSLTMAVLFPSLINWLIVSMYGGIFAKRGLNKIRIPRISGLVTDVAGQPIENVIIRLSQTETNQLTALVTTNAKGEFRVDVKPDVYQISATKQGFVWQRPADATLSFEEADVRSKPDYKLITMTNAAEIYKQLFE